MKRLTHERVNGIKTGYWSAATKETLLQRLAAHENTGLEPEEIGEAIKSALPGLLETFSRIEVQHGQRKALQARGALPE